MSKHIKIIAKLSEDRKTVFCSIVEQTHRGSDFGTDHTSNFLHNNIRLRSNNNPAFGFCQGVCTLYVRGRGVGNDHIKTAIPIRYWDGVKEAIEAYNAYFK